MIAVTHDGICTAEISEPYLRDYRTRMGEGFRCARPARFFVDDKPLCRLHAGHVTVAKLLAGETPQVKEC